MTSIERTAHPQFKRLTSARVPHVFFTPAAALGASFRRIALYEPAGPQTTQDNWPERVTAIVADGQVGRAAFTFLTEIIGLTPGEVEALRDAPGGRDVLPIAADSESGTIWRSLPQIVPLS